jgi:hypothetical protein
MSIILFNSSGEEKMLRAFKRIIIAPARTIKIANPTRYRMEDL